MSNRGRTGISAPNPWMKRKIIQELRDYEPAFDLVQTDLDEDCACEKKAECERAYPG